MIKMSTHWDGAKKWNELSFLEHLNTCDAEAKQLIREAATTTNTPSL